MTTNQNHPGKLPEKIKIFDTPFYYSSFYNVEGYFLLPFTEKLEDLLKYSIYKGLTPYVKDNMVLIGHNFQHYTGQSKNSTGITNEIEYNILCFPTKYAERVPDLSFEEILKGKDTTKLIGNFRLLVTCDNRFAVKAGIDLYNEEKMIADFTFNIPSLNNFTENCGIWEINCSKLRMINKVPNDQSDFDESWKEPKNDTNVFDKPFSTFYANTKCLDEEIVNIAPVTQFGNRNEELIGCNLNIQVLSKLYLKPRKANLSLEFENIIFATNSDSKQLNYLAENSNSLIPFAIRTAQSQPVAIQNGPYYI